MKMVSEKTYEFLIDRYQRAVQEFFDDPDEQFTGWNHQEFLAWYEDMLVVAKDCNLDFWRVAEDEGTEYEIARVKTMLKRAGHPEFASHEPEAD